MVDEAELKRKADEIRREVVDVAVRNGAGHIAPSLSCVDILVALYYSVMSYRQGDPFWENRDRLVVSKAHGAYAVFPILVDKGVIPRAEWEHFYTENSSLPGCIERRLEYGLEAGCGALGHGLPMAVGIAFGAKMQRAAYHTYCLLGDGELQEGTNWEAIQFAVKHELGQLTIIVDHNGLQAMDATENVMDRDRQDLRRRLRGFGLEPVECPGHDVGVLARTLRTFRESTADRPAVLDAQTVKGYGLKCMENIAKFHFRIPNRQEIEQGWTTIAGRSSTS